MKNYVKRQYNSDIKRRAMELVSGDISKKSNNSDINSQARQSHRDSEDSDVGTNHLMVTGLYDDDAQERKSSISFDKIKQISLTYSLQSEDEPQGSGGSFDAMDKYGCFQGEHSAHDQASRDRSTGNNDGRESCGSSNCLSPEEGENSDISRKISVIDLKANLNKVVNDVTTTKMDEDQIEVILGENNVKSDANGQSVPMNKCAGDQLANQPTTYNNQHMLYRQSRHDDDGGDAINYIPPQRDFLRSNPFAYDDDDSLTLDAYHQQNYDQTTSTSNNATNNEVGSNGTSGEIYYARLAGTRSEGRPYYRSDDPVFLNRQQEYQYQPTTSPNCRQRVKPILATSVNVAGDEANEMINLNHSLGTRRTRQVTSTNNKPGSTPTGQYSSIVGGGGADTTAAAVRTPLDYRHSASRTSAGWQVKQRASDGRYSAARPVQVNSGGSASRTREFLPKPMSNQSVTRSAQNQASVGVRLNQYNNSISLVLNETDASITISGDQPESPLSDSEPSCCGSMDCASATIPIDNELAFGNHQGRGADYPSEEEEPDEFDDELIGVDDVGLANDDDVGDAEDEIVVLDDSKAVLRDGNTGRQPVLNQPAMVASATKRLQTTMALNQSRQSIRSGNHHHVQAVSEKSQYKTSSMQRRVDEPYQASHNINLPPPLPPKPMNLQSLATTTRSSNGRPSSAGASNGNYLCRGDIGGPYTDSNSSINSSQLPPTNQEADNCFNNQESNPTGRFELDNNFTTLINRNHLTMSSDLSGNVGRVNGEYNRHSNQEGYCRDTTSMGEQAQGRMGTACKQRSLVR